jgi:hypothetical protein
VGKDATIADGPINKKDALTMNEQTMDNGQHKMI